jgi:hopene-associated glycosyltransferase HpnB
MTGDSTTLQIALEAVAALALLAWLYLLLLHGGFWRARERLPQGLPAPASWPPVVAIVPARDEAATIAATLEGLLGQRYAGLFRIILVDDGSRDGTGEIARALAARDGGGRLSVLAGKPLAPGWTGKLWAVAQGIEAAKAGGAADWLFLTDADIRHGPDTLDRLVRQAAAGRYDLVSLMARLHCGTFWERLLIPAFVYFFQKLYPFAWAADPRRDTAAAAGGCVLVRARPLEALGGIAAIRGRLIDDCALARAVKRSGGRLWIGLAAEALSLRVYDRLAPIWMMVARSAFTQLRHSAFLLIGTVLGMALLYLAPPLILVAAPWHGDRPAALLAAAADLAMAASSLPMLAYYGRRPWEGFLLPLAGLLYTLMTLDSARRYWFVGGNRWKGRDYARSGASAHARDGRPAGE